MTMTEASAHDPAQAAGNVAQRHEAMMAVAREVVPLFDLEPGEGQAQFREFVDLRMGELSPDQQPAVGLINQGSTDEFIGPYTNMVLSALTTRPYHMDDPEAYTTAFQYVRSTYNRLIADGFSPEKAYLNAAMYGTNYGQARYFDSVTGNPQARLDIAEEFIDEDQEDLSIADFKRVAMCQERAATVHNTLRILGVESQFATGIIEVEQEDGSVESEPHAMVLLRSNSGKQILLDPTNPILVWSADGTLAGVRPAFYEYSPDQDGRQTVELRELTEADGSTQVSRRRQVTYTVDSPN